MKSLEHLAVPNWVIAESDDKPVDFVVIAAATQLDVNKVNSIKAYLNRESIVIKSLEYDDTNNNVLNILITASSKHAYILFDEMSELGLNTHFDVAVFPADRPSIKLMVCDMDSTIVQTETLDELANFAGVGSQVSEITAKAMRGEIDFETALNERVGLLAGMSADLLHKVAVSTPFNGGAESLINSAKKNNIRTVLVSGGFEPIVKLVANKLGFDRYVCNTMVVENGLISGEVNKPIVDGEMKLAVLKEECERLNINPSQACAIGDGANDMQMIQTAGIGISYYGKSILRTKTPYQINSTDLTSVLYMLVAIN